MPKYTVTINLNSISYDIESDNEDNAIAQAEAFALEESQYDLIKWAYYDVREDN
jgi:hypothetical protein